MMILRMQRELLTETEIETCTGAIFVIVTPLSADTTLISSLSLSACFTPASSSSCASHASSTEEENVQIKLHRKIIF